MVYGLFTRWTHEIKTKSVGIVPSVPQTIINCGYACSCQLCAESSASESSQGQRNRGQTPLSFNSDTDGTSPSTWATILVTKLLSAGKIRGSCDKISTALILGEVAEGWVGRWQNGWKMSAKCSADRISGQSCSHGTGKQMFYKRLSFTASCDNTEILTLSSQVCQRTLARQ